MKKIAILGGGIGSLAAAYKLTQQPDWKNRFDITVYQMGWRLGGKGASSRNQAFGDRIEEHGLHVWAGFYENAFALMRAAYAARPPCDSPIQTVEDAFIPESHVILADNSSGKWEPWNLYFPPQPGQPGDGNPAPLRSLAEHADVDEFVCGAAIETFVVLAHTGRMPRDEVVAYFPRLVPGKTPAY